MTMNFQPYPTRSGFVSLGIGLIAGAVAVLLIRLLPQQSNLPDVFKLLVGVLLIFGVIGLALYWAVIAFKLHYHLSRNGLAIQWGFAQQLIPFESIERIIPGKNISIPLKFRGLNVAGLRVGRGELPEFGKLKFHATTTLAESLLVVTPHQTYVISPRQPDYFLRAWQARQALGPTQDWTVSLRRSWPFSYSLLADPLTWQLFSLGAFACFALLGYLCLIFPDLPRSLPIHFNAFGVADRIADKSTLFTLPAVGAAVLLINTLLGSLIYRWEKVAAYLLWSSATIMQICLWFAILTLTR